MSCFVLDCSVAIAWCFEDEYTPQNDALLERVRDDGALVPVLWFWEVANVFNGAIKRGRITASDASARLRLMKALPIEVDSDGIKRAWEETLMIARSESLSVYDAAYLELATRLGIDLASNDKALRAAADLRGVKVVP